MRDAENKQQGYLVIIVLQLERQLSYRRGGKLTYSSKRVLMVVKASEAFPAGLNILRKGMRILFFFSVKMHMELSSTVFSCHIVFTWICNCMVTFFRSAGHGHVLWRAMSTCERIKNVSKQNLEVCVLTVAATKLYCFADAHSQKTNTNIVFAFIFNE